jgi:alpha-L-fucosidase
MEKVNFWVVCAMLVFQAPVRALADDMPTPANFDPYKETPAEFDARAQWLRDAKLGVFVHWNPSSVIGQEISWSRKDYGPAKYDQLYKQFRGEHFNADEWIKFFHESGIRYAVFVPKHHDGFCMFDTKTSDYNIMHSPFGRDYIKEVATACAKSDVRFCLYYSVLDWWNPKYSSAAGADLTSYMNDVFKPHMKELLTHYGPVGYVWFDGNWEESWTHAYGREMYGYIRSLQPATLLGNRVDRRPAYHGDWRPVAGAFFNAPDAVGDFQAREMWVGNYYTNKAWDSCYNISPNGWSWTPPMAVRPLNDLIRWLIQCAGRDGGMLLGVSPRTDGTIDPPQAARLLELGDWLKLNGGAIYGTRGGPYLPGSWGVSTRKANEVYLFVDRWKGDTLKLPILPAGIVSARLVTGGTITLEPDSENLVLHVPAIFHRPVATIVELTLNQEAMSLPVIEVPEPTNLALGKPVQVSSIWTGRESELDKAHITDGDLDTTWAAEEKARDGWVTVDLGNEIEVRQAMLSDLPFHRTQAFDLEAQVDGKWKKIAEGKTIGDGLQMEFEPVRTRLFRLNIRQASDTPTLSEFQLFNDKS